MKRLRRASDRGQQIPARRNWRLRQRELIVLFDPRLQAPTTVTTELARQPARVSKTERLLKADLQQRPGQYRRTWRRMPTCRWSGLRDGDGPAWKALRRAGDRTRRDARKAKGAQQQSRGTGSGMRHQAGFRPRNIGNTDVANAGTRAGVENAKAVHGLTIHDADGVVGDDGADRPRCRSGGTVNDPCLQGVGQLTANGVDIPAVAGAVFSRKHHPFKLMDALVRARQVPQHAVPRWHDHHPERPRRQPAKQPATELSKWATFRGWIADHTAFLRRQRWHNANSTSNKPEYLPILDVRLAVGRQRPIYVGADIHRQRLGINEAVGASWPIGIAR